MWFIQIGLSEDREEEKIKWKQIVSIQANPKLKRNENRMILNRNPFISILFLSLVKSLSIDFLSIVEVNSLISAYPEIC